MSVTGTWETEQKGGKSDIGASLGNVPMSKRKKKRNREQEEGREGGRGRGEQESGEEGREGRKKTGMEESWKREEVKIEISLGKQCFSGSLNSKGGGERKNLLLNSLWSQQLFLLG